MPDITITITISDAELSVDDRALIQDCLGIDNVAFQGALERLTKSAFMEYAKMFKEKGIPTRADEVAQERLYFLLNHYYNTTLPSESEISSIFQLTQSQSKTLLKNTKSRYRTKIKAFLKNSLKATLAAAVQRGGENLWEFECISPSIIEELNYIVSQKGPSNHPVEKIRGFANRYSCKEDTYVLLNNELN